MSSTPPAAGSSAGIPAGGASGSPISADGGDSAAAAKGSADGDGAGVLDSEAMDSGAVASVEGDGEKVLDRRVRYNLPPEEENAGFSAADMVWGKVRSHPWWPGQIFDPKYASDTALKLHRKKDGRFLVAFFGDGTFAWCDEPQLKPFRSCFPEMEKQKGSVAFVAAVSASVEEASRRVELGLSCSCVDEGTYSGLKCRVVVNAGIREGTCSPSVDEDSVANSFDPRELLEYVTALAWAPSSMGADSLGVAMATAQLKAFLRSEGHKELPVDVLLKNDAEILVTGKKRSRVKIKNVQDVMGSLGVGDGSTVTSRKKRPRGRQLKVQNISDEDDHDDPGYKGSGRKRVDGLEAVSPLPIRTRSARVGALQSIDDSSGVRAASTRKKRVPTKEYPPSKEMLSQLCLLARDPSFTYGFLPKIVSFFTDLRATFSNGSPEEQKNLKSAGRRKKLVADPYWDKLLQSSSSESEPVSGGQKSLQGSKGGKQKKKAKSTAVVDNTPSPSPTDQQELAGEGPTSDAVEKK